MAFFFSQKCSPTFFESFILGIGLGFISKLKVRSGHFVACTCEVSCTLCTYHQETLGDGILISWMNSDTPYLWPRRIHALLQYHMNVQFPSPLLLMLLAFISQKSIHSPVKRQSNNFIKNWEIKSSNSIILSILVSILLYSRAIWFSWNTYYTRRTVFYFLAFNFFPLLIFKVRTWFNSFFWMVTNEFPLSSRYVFFSI